MNENSYKGKLIAFDGLDGSGKATQANLLVKYLQEQGFDAAIIDFPQYGTKSAGLVENYLNGKYGGPEDVNPYLASIFYACDRYDSSFLIKKWLRDGKIVVSDRYVGSNIGHQGGKIKEKQERVKFIKWLYNLEYQIFGIPKPNVTFILKTSPKISWKMTGEQNDEKKKEKRRFYLGEKIRDIHEDDLSHLKPAFLSYLEASQEFPQDFKVIECLENDELLAPEIIHQKILKHIKEILKDYEKNSKNH